MSRGFKEPTAAAKAWARPHGIRGEQGGWLYQGERRLCQGWGTLAHHLQHRGVIGRDERRRWQVLRPEPLPLRVYKGRLHV